MAGSGERTDGIPGSVHERGDETLYQIFLESVGLSLFVLKRTYGGENNTENYISLYKQDVEKP